MRIKRKSSAPVKYVPISQRDLPQDEQFHLMMRPLDVFERARVRDKMVEFGEDGEVEGFRTFSITIEVAALCLDGWANLIDDETGNEIVFDGKKRNDCFSLLPDEIQDELATVYGTGVKNEKAEKRLVAAAEAEADEADDDDSGDDTE